MKLKPIDQQVVVVFGASSGIGRETALRFARKGATVVVAARGEEGLNTLVEEIRRGGGEAAAIVADTSDFEQVQAVADLTARQYGRLDTWVHAAAVSVYAPFAETTPREFTQIIDVNLTGQAYGAMAALPYLRQNGGALIHISSIEAKRPLPLHSAYAASKHGIHGFVETLRMELAHDKIPISVTEILPATINTPFFNHARTKIGVKPQGPPPVYEPGVVADAILYAAAHPVREMVVGGEAKAMLASQRISSRATDALFSLVGFAAQETQEPKSEDDPDDVYAPDTGDNRAEGDFSGRSRKSVDSWFGTHPAARIALFGTAIVGAFLLTRWGRSRSEVSSPPQDGAPQVMEVADLEAAPTDVVERMVVIPATALGPDDALSVSAATADAEARLETTAGIILLLSGKDRPALETAR